MSELVKALGEYFFGIETHKRYRAQRAFYRENVLDSSLLDFARRRSLQMEIADIFVKRVVPATIEAFCINNALDSGDSGYYLGLAVSQYIRLFTRPFFTERDFMNEREIAALYELKKEKSADVPDSIEEIDSDE